MIIYENGFPKATLTPLLVQFYRCNHATDRRAFASPTSIPTPRFPYVSGQQGIPNGVESIYDYGVHGVSTNPYFIGGVEFVQTPLPSIEWTNDKVLQWLESEYPLYYQWGRGPIALLPEVEVPALFFNRHKMIAAVNMYGELGVVSESVRDSFVIMDFEDSSLNNFKSVAQSAGWDMIEHKPHLLMDRPVMTPPSRIDDGKFDHKTFSFWAGSRCHWCGSSSVTPPFIAVQRACISCKTIGNDNIADRNQFNADDFV